MVPAVTGSGESVLISRRSASVVTAVVVDALAGVESKVELEEVKAVLGIDEPSATEEATRAAMVKVTDPGKGIPAEVHETV